MKILRTLLYIMLKIDRRGPITTAIRNRVAKRKKLDRINDKIDAIVQDMEMLHRFALMSKCISDYQSFDMAYHDKCTKDTLFRHYAESTQHRIQ